MYIGTVIGGEKLRPWCVEEYTTDAVRSTLWRNHFMNLYNFFQVIFDNFHYKERRENK